MSTMTTPMVQMQELHAHLVTLRNQMGALRRDYDALLARVEVLEARRRPGRPRKVEAVPHEESVA